MSRSVLTERPVPAQVQVALLCAVLLVLPTNRISGQTACEPCHAELELLRQHVRTLDEARALWVTKEAVEASAHAGIACSECHAGYTSFPHPGSLATPQPAAKACASCHASADTAWMAGIHATDEKAGCSSCHGVHDVRSVEQLATRSGITEMKAACSDCHFEPVFPRTDPHADSVSCADCHEPHATLPASDPQASVHVLNQWRTCGNCHDSISSAWVDDAHAKAVAQLAIPGAAPPAGATTGEPPSCTACHGAHGMLPVTSRVPGRGIAGRCRECHENYAKSFADSYHGQAGTLGSESAATCYDCHSAHSVHPRSDPRSTIADDRLLETCRSCHESATAGFELFQPHADHHDQEKYPHVYWSYRLMTWLLIGVFVFFGLHSMLWVVRWTLDRSRDNAQEVDHAR